MERHSTNNPYRKTALIITFLFACLLSSQAQVYIGGGFSRYKTEEDLDDDPYYTKIYKVKNFYIAPEIGYEFSKFAVGISFGYINKIATKEYSDHTVETITTKGIEAIPYFRWNAIEVGTVAFFLDTSFNYSKISVSSVDKNGFRIAVQPGLSFDMTDRLSAMLHFGLIGYSNNIEIFGHNGLGADLSMSTATLSFYYHFR